jgi:hypothetical protein
MDKDKIIVIELKHRLKTQLPCFLDSQYLADKAKNQKIIMTDIKHDLELNETGKDKILVPDVFRRGGLHGKK